MPLPILETPKYTLTVPSTGKTIEYRPFLVKEEKILLVAQETNEESSVLSALKDIIKACTFDAVNPSELTSFDIEYIFLKLRSKSVGEISEIRCKCEKCQVLNDISINIDSIEITWPKDKNQNVIMLTDTIGITLKYLSIADIDKLNLSSKKQADTIIETIIAMIENVFDDKGVYPSAETSHAEMIAFISSLNRSQMAKIEEYINNLPKLQHDLQFTCVSCKHPNELTLSGTQSFFE
jgi:phage FluMu protein Com